MKTNLRILSVCLLVILFNLRLSHSQTYNSIDWGITLDDNFLPNDDGIWDNEEQVEQVLVDNTTTQEKIYIVGRTYRQTAVMDCNGSTTTLDKGDVFVACYQANSTGMGIICGALQWLSYLGDYDGSDYGYCLATDHLLTTNMLFVAGAVQSNNNTAGNCNTCVSTIYQANNADSKDGFIARFNSDDGSLVSWTFFGGTGEDIILDMTVVDHKVYFCGYTESDNFAVSPDVTTSVTTVSGGGDGFFAAIDECLSDLLLFAYYNVKYSPNGGSNTNDTDRCHSLKVYTVAGVTYIALQGTAESSTGIATVDANGSWTVDASDISLGGTTDAFIGLWQVANGVLTCNWSTYFGGGSTERGRQLDLDNSHNIFVTGWTGSSANSFPTGTCNGYDNGITNDNAGGIDGYAAKISANTTTGYADWTTFLGGSGSDFAGGMKWFSVGGTSYAMVTGYTSSTNFPTANYLKNTISGDWDVFITVLTSPVPPLCTGGQTLSFSTYLGGNLDESTNNPASNIVGYGPYVSFGPHQELYIAFKGYSAPAGSNTIISTMNAACTCFQHMICDYHATGVGNTIATDRDAFLLKLIDDGNPAMYNCTYYWNRNAQIQSSVENSIDIAPNPTSASLKFNLPPDATGCSVLNLSGKELISKSFKINTKETNMEIDVSSLPNGMYFLKIKSESDQFVIKFDVQR